MMSRWLRGLHAIGMPVIILLFTQISQAQNIANSETNSANGLCIGCWVQNSSNTADTGVYTTYGTMKLTVALLGAYVTEKLQFSHGSTASHTLYLVLESANATLLNVTALGGLQITTYYRGASNLDTRGSSSITINLLSGSSTKYVIGIDVGKSYDAVELRLNAGITSALTNLRVYSAFFMGSALPVKLTSFTGYSDGRSAHLDWTTAAEINNDYYSIERSSDGTEYTSIGTVAGAGTTNQQMQYSYQDVAPLSGTSYYRLRQTDYDGKSELSDIISITSGTPPSAKMQLRNNPVHDAMSLSYHTTVSGTTEIEVIDMQGRRLVHQREACTIGFNEYRLSDLSSLPAGQYAVRLIQDGAVEVSRFTKLP